MDFTAAIRTAIRRSSVLIALIGPEWIATGRDRLDVEDWVREELHIALKERKRVIPVLVDGAKMPRRDDLPEALAPLANIQAAQLRYESFASDVEQLIAHIKEPKR